LTTYANRAFFSLTYSDEDVERIAVVHALNRMMISKGFREEFHRALGVRNVDELFEKVPKQILLERFLQRVRELIPRNVLDEALSEVRRILKSGVGVIPFYSPYYPDELRTYRTGSLSVYPPLILYVKPSVSLNSFRYVAVVGTRECSNWGRETAYRVGSLIAEMGYAVVTGLAKCIDEYATRGALERGGVAAGVRPWLEPPALPEETRAVVEAHRDRVVLVAEHFRRPPVKSVNMLYYLRNRIIAGMAKLVVVVEARERGGSMHQVEWALKHGRPLAIFEHPDRNSEYYRAYLKYLEYFNRLAHRRPQLHRVRSAEELADILSKLSA